MSGLQRKDYLLRQLKAVSAMLARLAGLRTDGRLDEARVELDQAYGLLLGSQADLTRQVDSHTAAMLLRTSDRIVAFARLVTEEAAQEADLGRSAELRLRATELGIEAALADRGDPAVGAFLAEILATVDRTRLAPAYRAALEQLEQNDAADPSAPGNS